MYVLEVSNNIIIKFKFILVTKTKMSSSSSTAKLALLVVGGITTLAALTYFLLKRPVVEKKNDANNNNTTDNTTTTTNSTKEEKTKPVIPKQALCEIFREVTKEMSKVIHAIGMLEQQFLEEAAQGGRNVDPDVLREHLINKFITDVKEAEGQVYSRYGVTQADVEAAAQYFHDDADFEKEVKNLRRKFALFTGQGIEDVPEHVTMELVMDVLSETMMKMTAAMEEVYYKTKEAHEVGTEAFAQTLQTSYVEKVAVIRSKVQKKYDIDQVCL
jgi:hypothetical protein